MYKSLAVMALVMGASAIDLKFAEGQAPTEWDGETIQVKGPSGMESYNHVQLSRMDKGEKKKYGEFL